MPQPLGGRLATRGELHNSWASDTHEDPKDRTHSRAQPFLEADAARGP